MSCFMKIISNLAFAGSNCNSSEAITVEQSIAGPCQHTPISGQVMLKSSFHYLITECLKFYNEDVIANLERICTKTISNNAKKINGRSKRDIFLSVALLEWINDLNRKRQQLNKKAAELQRQEEQDELSQYADLINSKLSEMIAHVTKFEENLDNGVFPLTFMQALGISVKHDENLVLDHCTVAKETGMIAFVFCNSNTFISDQVAKSN